jgi:dephospho-CoA kinase
LQSKALVKRVGLTGGIASGKSTVCEQLRRRGCLILDADQIAHQLIVKGQPCYTPVVEVFGPQILNDTGKIDRQKLGNLAFHNPALLQHLNRIIHPEVIRQIQMKLAIIEAESSRSRTIVEASVMIESGFHTSFQYLILVTCTPAQQIERLWIRNGLSEGEARLRMAAQLPLEEKKSLADWVIDNSGSLEQTQAQVDRLWQELTDRVWVDPESGSVHRTTS